MLADFVVKARTEHNQPTFKISQESQDYFPNRKQTYASQQGKEHSWMAGMNLSNSHCMSCHISFVRTITVLSNGALLAKVVLDVSKAMETLTQNATRGAKNILSTELITFKAQESTLPDVKTLKITVATSKGLTH